jgi:hypothetical protein
MAGDAGRPAGQHGGEGTGGWRERPDVEAVDAAVKQVEAAGLQAVVDSARAEAGVQQLGAGDEAVLPCRQVGQ